ncbi:MAG: putative Radical SAM domain protein [Anaerolineaceae bacterium]|nr:MAG: putative Radical SAM domain protein [Anaerolineaceae bacterium]
MLSSELTTVQKLKISCLGRGIRISDDIKFRLSAGGKTPLSIHEYATTGGITLKFGDEIYVNAPFDEWYCNNPDAELTVGSNDELQICFHGEYFSAKILPLPGFLGSRDSKGNPVIETVMSHADRIRLSPIYGCSFGCQFCDFVGKKYLRRPLEQVLEGYEIARQDQALPARHTLISGGTPSQRDYDYIDTVYEKIIKNSPLPVDIMLAPRKDNIIDKLVDWGANGFSINLEVYDEEISSRVTPQKHRIGLELFAKFIEHAVKRIGTNGKVRSLILVGLEPEEKTLQGVEFLARLGCDPVLSPFRPAPGTPLAGLQPPEPGLLEHVYLRSREIVERYGVKLGPRCIPCQHNTLTLPDGSSAYYFSSDSNQL